MSLQLWYELLNVPTILLDASLLSIRKRYPLIFLFLYHNFEISFLFIRDKSIFSYSYNFAFISNFIALLSSWCLYVNIFPSPWPPLRVYIDIITTYQKTEWQVINLSHQELTINNWSITRCGKVRKILSEVYFIYKTCKLGDMGNIKLQFFVFLHLMCVFQ